MSGGGGQKKQPPLLFPPCQHGLSAWPLWRQRCRNYRVFTCQYDTDVGEDAQSARPAVREVHPQLLSERREKWRFVYRRIIIAIGIYEAHQAFTGVGAGGCGF